MDIMSYINLLLSFDCFGIVSWHLIEIAVQYMNVGL